MRILLVDDDERRRNGLRTFLARKRIASHDDIFVASSADEAREYLKRIYFDTLVLDVVIPKRHKEKADSRVGLGLLAILSQNRGYKKPERIIGITAHLDDIRGFQEEFAKYCLFVLEANIVNAGWQRRICDAIAYVSDSKIVRSIQNDGVRTITIHGILTFGNWQERLQKIALGKLGDMSFHSYKYGLFSLFAFAVKCMREREVNRLASYLRRLFVEHKGDRFVLFAHSFGTHLAVEAIKDITSECGLVPIDTIVLCGSVLPQGFDLSALRKNDIRLINDCGDGDYVLYLSQIFIPGLGMAGKCGFYGFNDNKFVNRFFQGGHSHYFEGDEFMTNYWIPLYATNVEAQCVDLRHFSHFRHGLLDKLALLAGNVMRLAYILLAIFGLLFFVGWVARW